MPASKLLVVTRHSPLPENDGAGAYLFDLLSYVAASGTKIELVWIKAEEAFVRRGWWRVPARLNSVAKVRIIGTLAVGRYRFFWWGRVKAQVLGTVKTVLLRTRLWKPSSATKPTASSRPPIPTRTNAEEPDWSELPSVHETRFFRERLLAFRPNAVLANYCWLLPIIPRSVAAQKFVLTHDVASHRLNLKDHAPKVAAGEYSPATPEGETRLLELADVILAISEDDAAAFRSMVPNRAVLVAPKSAQLRLLSGPAVAGRCLFVGGINPPNREGLAWFLERVWPLVREQRPDATLHVCGGICRTVVSPPAGVKLLGRIESLDTEYRDAQLVVVPLLQGTGVKIKLVEACSHGKACVTTPVGLQGLSFLRPGVIETVSPEDFAQSVVRLLDDRNLREELQRRISGLVAEHLSPDQCYGAVRGVMRRATSPAPTTPAKVAPTADRKPLVREPA